MQIKEVPASIFQAEPKQLQLHKTRGGWWNWRTDVVTPMQSYTVDLTFKPHLDMQGFPCFTAYDAEGDTL